MRRKRRERSEEIPAPAEKPIEAGDHVKVVNNSGEEIARLCEGQIGVVRGVYLLGGRRLGVQLKSGRAIDFLERDLERA
jgi:hypothetical protein